MGYLLESWTSRTLDQNPSRIIVVFAEDAPDKKGLKRGLAKRSAADVGRIAESRDLILIFGRRNLDGGGGGGTMNAWRRCRS